MLELFAESTNRLRQALVRADPSVLQTELPDDDLPTMALLLLQVVVAHTAYHAGQLAVWRRALGMEPAGVFV